MHIICRYCFGTFIVTVIYAFYALKQNHTAYARSTITIIYFKDLLCDCCNLGNNRYDDVDASHRIHYSRKRSPIDDDITMFRSPLVKCNLWVA